MSKYKCKCGADAWVAVDSINYCHECYSVFRNGYKLHGTQHEEIKRIENQRQASRSDQGH